MRGYRTERTQGGSHLRGFRVALTLLLRSAVRIFRCFIMLRLRIVRMGDETITYTWYMFAGYPTLTGERERLDAKQSQNMSRNNKNKGKGKPLFITGDHS